MNTTAIDPKSVAIAITHRSKQLPSIGAVYFVLHKNEVIYIGKSNVQSSSAGQHKSNY